MNNTAGKWDVLSKNGRDNESPSNPIDLMVYEGKQHPILKFVHHGNPGDFTGSPVTSIFLIGPHNFRVAFITTGVKNADKLHTKTKS